MFIKVDDILNATVNKNSIWLHITDNTGRNLAKIISELPKYDLTETKAAKKEKKTK